MATPPLPEEQVEQRSIASVTGLHAMLQCSWSSALLIPFAKGLMRTPNAIIGNAAHLAIQEWIEGKPDSDLAPASHLRACLARIGSKLPNDHPDLRLMPLPDSLKDRKPFIQAVRLVGQVRQRLRRGQGLSMHRQRPLGTAPATRRDELPAVFPSGSWTGAEIWFEDTEVRLRGQIDLLILDSQTISIIDHKTGYSIDADESDELFAKYAKQLNLYALVLDRRYPGKKIELTIWAKDGEAPVSLDLVQARKDVASILGSLDTPKPSRGDYCGLCPKRHACRVYLHDINRWDAPLSAMSPLWSFDIWGILLDPPKRFADGSWQLRIKDPAGNIRTIDHLDRRHTLEDFSPGDPIWLFGLRPMTAIEVGQSIPYALHGGRGSRVDGSTIFSAAVPSL